MALNVMVVDDSTVMRKIIRQTLIMSGLEIGAYHQAGNGREGIAILEKEWVDIIFVDINMPVMDGLEFIANLKKNQEWSSIPVIVISSETSKTRIDEFKKQGIDFIHKPFTPEEVYEKVKKMV